MRCWTKWCKSLTRSTNCESPLFLNFMSREEEGKGGGERRGEGGRGRWERKGGMERRRGITSVGSKNGLKE